ncbi:MAG: class I SAM-dependent RNA methyltransferase [Oligoflexia bacterium]|nr:class I SAM-dependent RNA methyltransferase [Oligoflexia bacterium]
MTEKNINIKINENESKNENENIFTGRVRNLSSKGLGVVEHTDGKVFFVRGVWPGDYGEFRIDLFKKKYGFATLVKLIEASDERISSEVPCAFQGHIIGKCGGCPWMMAQYQHQLKYKEHHILHTLSRFKITDSNTDSNVNLNLDFIKKIWPSDNIYQYRNRLQLKTDGVHIGMVSAGSNVLVPLNDCIILNKNCRNLLAKLVSKLPCDEWKPTSHYKWNFLEIDDKIESIESIESIDSIEEIKLNKRRPFLQGNNEQNQKMRQWLHIKLTELFSYEKDNNLNYDSVVVELFSGSGNFTEILSNFGLNKIFACEVQGEAVQIAKEKKLKGVTSLAIDLYSKNIWRKLAKEFLEIRNAKLIILNPPREGLDNRNYFFEIFPKVEAIVYISCDIETYSRDVCDFLKRGFKVLELQPLDQFPHTPHVEVLSILKKIPQK